MIIAAKLRSKSIGDAAENTGTGGGCFVAICLCITGELAPRLCSIFIRRDPVP